MQIYVLQTWNGKVISLKVKSSDTIENVRLKISEKLEIPMDDKIIFYKEQPLLQESRTLREYSIPEKATLHLRLRLRG